MKQLKSLTLNLSLITSLFLFSMACTESQSIVDPAADSDIAQLQKLVDEDEVIQSFEPNYNEDEAMDIVNSDLAKAIFPVRVGQKMRLIERQVTFDIQNDTAYGRVVSTFEGILFIAASYDKFVPGDTSIVDTLIQKNFTTTVTRNVVFVKVNNSLRPDRNWRIYKMSLPNGGTDTDNIEITKLTIILPDGREIIVDDPNEYYLTRDPGFFDQLPIISRGEKVTIKVELNSAYEDEDFVTLTHGALKGDRHKRAKRRFKLVSSETDGAYYKKVYQNVWEANRFPGFKHAIINAMPRQVIFDDETPVETNSWGMPYIVK